MRMDKNNYPQVYLKECKYKIKNTQISRFINPELYSDSESHSQSDDNSDNDSDNDSDSDSDNDSNDNSDNDSDNGYK